MKAFVGYGYVRARCHGVEPAADRRFGRAQQWRFWQEASQAKCAAPRRLKWQQFRSSSALGLMRETPWKKKAPILAAIGLRSVVEAR